MSEERGKASEEEPALTVLWGTWEMWCDVPSELGHGETNPSVRASQPSVTSTNINTLQTTAATSGTVEQTSWLDRVRSVGLFDSAEGFWGLFQCTLLPSQLPPGTTYYLFRKHIAPMWEHEANRRGGRWVIPFTHSTTCKASSASNVVSHAVPPSETTKEEEEQHEGGTSVGTIPILPVDIAWQNLCLAVIGELLPCEEEEVCGVTVSRSKPRPGMAATMGEWKLSLWTRTAEDAETQMNIAAFVKKLIEQPERMEEDEDDDAAVEAGTPSANAKISISYVVHREVMLAKQRTSKGGAGAPFAPRYVL